MSDNKREIVDLSAMIVSAYVANNSVHAGNLGKLIEDTHAALTRVGREVEIAPSEPLVPAVSIKKSITPDALICLEDGKSFKSLKRHLSSKFGLTPDQYRAKWNLPADYPMVAPNYAEQRSALARSIGLGRKPGDKPKSRKKATA